MAEYTLTASQSACIKWADPNTNFSADAVNRAYEYDDAASLEKVLFSFTAPAELKLKALSYTNFRTSVYVSAKDQSPSGFAWATELHLGRIPEAWEQASVTWNNRYALPFRFAIKAYPDVPIGWNTFNITGFSDLNDIKNFINNGLYLAAQAYDEYVDFNIHTSRGANPPVLYVNAESVSLEIGNLLPAGGFVYRGSAKQFSWTATQPAAAITIDPVVQASAKLRYRKVGVTPYTELSISGATNNYTIPANTFDGASNYEWQVAVTSNDSVVTTSSWIQFSTSDSTPGTPSLTSPVDVYAGIDETIDFSWQHIVDTGTPQTKADLEYSSDGGAWTALTTITGAAQTYTCPADILPAGSLRWRARTYNTDNVAGAWSTPAAFVGVGAPAPPTLSGVPASSRPTIAWQSAGQTGYQLQILQASAVIHDTGETAGAEKTYTLPIYLANGTYTLQIRVINSLLLWSAWTTLSFTLAVTPPPAPTIIASAIQNGAHIDISDIDAGVIHMYLLRDGVPVADITGATDYDDYAALGYSQYAARVVDASNNYADSAVAWINVVVASAVLASADDLSNVVSMNKKSAGQPMIAWQKQIVGTAQHYAGREQPVHVFSEFTNENYMPSFYYTSLAEWKLLDALINLRQTVLYRDLIGNKFYGAITSADCKQESNMIVFALSILRVDYVEQIPYAEVGS